MKTSPTMTSLVLVATLTIAAFSKSPETRLIDRAKPTNKENGVSTASHANNPKDSLLLVFWNVENFFDYRSVSKPQGLTKSRFYTKCDAIAKTMLLISDQYGRYPDIIAFAEVESRFVIQQLVNSTLLRKLSYKIVHYESNDHRGIDCSLIYRGDKLKLKTSSPKHLLDSLGHIMPTRNILLAEFGSIDILVNHHPSKVGGGKTSTRAIAMNRMTSVVDSLLAAGHNSVLAVGDFNDTLWPDSQGKETLKYNGKWEKIDGYFRYGNLQVEEYVFNHQSLLTQDKNYGGIKPRRFFNGPQYQGGISDHLPIVLILKFQNTDSE